MSHTVYDRLGLGTVQFGLDYGATNAAGRTPEAEAGAILAAAHEAGVRLIDTAQAYGVSEEVLGRQWPPGHRFQVVTKIPAIKRPTITAADAQGLEDGVRNSLARLRLDAVDGLLLHHADDLLAEGGTRLFDALQALKSRGWVRKIGVSVYTRRQIDAVLERFAIDAIQVPINVLDQRLLAGGYLRELHARGIEIHARSAFLQGILLADPDSLDRWFDPIRPLLRSYRDWCAGRGLTPPQGALGLFAGLPEIAHVVVGVCSLVQFREILAAARGLSQFSRAPGAARSRKWDCPPCLDDYSSFACRDERMIDPSQWVLGGAEQQPS